RMEPESSQLRHREQLETAQQFAQQQGGREFASVEEMIREDIAQTNVPEGVAVRLKESISREGLGPRPWWKRIFSRNETQS
ncbi:hypothetical protein N2Q23_24925, partial [Escherichia coli]|uniref:hypothetical protein n=1 Tax=Escherichia coli TaxID=562 RepID=UPI0021B282EF